jgi:hypothetical protein
MLPSYENEEMRELKGEEKHARKATPGLCIGLSTAFQAQPK